MVTAKYSGFLKVLRWLAGQMANFSGSKVADLSCHKILPLFPPLLPPSHFKPTSFISLENRIPRRALMDGEWKRECSKCTAFLLSPFLRETCLLYFIFLFFTYPLEWGRLKVGNLEKLPKLKIDKVFYIGLMGVAKVFLDPI